MFYLKKIMLTFHDHRAGLKGGNRLEPTRSGLEDYYLILSSNSKKKLTSVQIGAEGLTKVYFSTHPPTITTKRDLQKLDRSRDVRRTVYINVLSRLSFSYKPRYVCICQSTTKNTIFGVYQKFFVGLGHYNT